MFDTHATSGAASRERSTVQAGGRLWSIVLAGGEGVRLRPLTRRICGDERPKQYASVFGSGSLLQQTVDRVSLLVAPERTVVVTQQRHARYIAPDLQGRRVPWVLPQPESRGTAAAVLLPAHLISWRDPEAIVAVFPSDHFVPDARAFMDHVARIVTFVGHHREWLLLLGARPAEAETEYGWIEPGPAIGDIAGEPAWRVRRFWEKPSPELARLAFASGCLWNTLTTP